MKKLLIVAYIVFVLILSAKARAISLDSDPCFDKFNHPVHSEQVKKVQDPFHDFDIDEMNQMNVNSKTENFVG